MRYSVWPPEEDSSAEPPDHRCQPREEETLRYAEAARERPGSLLLEGTGPTAG